MHPTCLRLLRDKLLLVELFRRTDPIHWEQCQAVHLRGVLMQFHQSIQDRKEILHPKCIQCGATMFLLEIESNGPDQDKRMFECTECGYELMELVKYA
jgi:DNA-directed RNA polymerase subunit RPC12/RpoP